MKLTDFTKAEVNVKDKKNRHLISPESFCDIFNDAAEDMVDFELLALVCDLEDPHFCLNENIESFAGKKLEKEEALYLLFESKQVVVEYWRSS